MRLNVSSRNGGHFVEGELSYKILPLNIRCNTLRLCVHVIHLLSSCGSLYDMFTTLHTSTQLYMPNCLSHSRRSAAAMATFGPWHRTSTLCQDLAGVQYQRTGASPTLIDLGILLIYRIHHKKYLQCSRLLGFLFGWYWSILAIFQCYVYRRH